MAKMLYNGRADHTCPYKCCGVFIKSRGTRHACPKWHRTLRSREKRAWKKEEWA